MGEWAGKSRGRRRYVRQTCERRGHQVRRAVRVGSVRHPCPTSLLPLRRHGKSVRPLCPGPSPALLPCASGEIGHGATECHSSGRCTQAVSHTTRYPTQDHRTPLLSISADATGAARNESGHLELGRVQRPKTAILSAFRRSPSQVPHIRHAHVTRGGPVTRGRRRARDRALVVRKSRARFSAQLPQRSACGNFRADRWKLSPLGLSPRWRDRRGWGSARVCYSGWNCGGWASNIIGMCASACVCLMPVAHGR